MTTLQQIENSLPNGFHDALVRSCHLDFVARTASLELDVCMGDAESADSDERDSYARATLLLDGLAFCEVQAPDPTYPFQQPAPLRVDLSEPDPAHPVIKSLPNDIFAGRFFVTSWNSFIYLAARHATLEWAPNQTTPPHTPRRADPRSTTG
jgi:hypothetical protein